MKAEVIREIAEKETAKPNERLRIAILLTEALRILEQAGFAVVKTEELEAALKPFAREGVKFETVPDNVYAYRHTPYAIRQYGETVDLKYCQIAIGDLRRAAALLAAITQEGRG